MARENLLYWECIIKQVNKGSIDIIISISETATSFIMIIMDEIAVLR